MKSFAVLFVGCIIICKSFALSESGDDDSNAMSEGRGGKTFFMQEPDVNTLEFEPYEKFLELRKLAAFPKESNDEVPDDETARVERDVEEKGLLAVLTGSEQKKKANKNKMDEKIKEVPHNSKFHGSQFQD